MKKTFWMKTYSENKGILEQLEKQNILRRTGEELDQGFVTLVGVETVLTRGQWSESCHGCGRREQLDDRKPRMLRCAKCKDRYYCNKKCQTSQYFFYCQRRPVAHENLQKDGRPTRKTARESVGSLLCESAWM